MTERRSAWTLDRRIGLSGIAAILTLTGAILAIYVRNDTRMTSMEIALTYQKGVNDQLRDSQKDIKADTNIAIGKVESAVRDLSAKVDVLLQRK